MEPLEEPAHHTGTPPKRPLIVGAVVGGMIGALFGLLITLLNLGGKGDWSLAVPGAVFDGVCLGVIVGAIVRESRADRGERAGEKGRFRVILLWAAVAVVVLVAGTIFVMR
ncbi:hypothetical protein AYO44_12285 [Planctomycetaceae bacterium SCGC AG-212-F19]|nr:hypothetical protein AYO44_12285 [Planctomycetaceae bacterium SCGC AG-212-F19]